MLKHVCSRARRLHFFVKFVRKFLSIIHSKRLSLKKSGLRKIFLKTFNSLFDQKVKLENLVKISAIKTIVNFTV